MKNLWLQIVLAFALLLTGCIAYTPKTKTGYITNLKFGEAKFVSTHMLAGHVKVTREATTLKFPYEQFGFTFDYRSPTPNPKFKLAITPPDMPAALVLPGLEIESSATQRTTEATTTLPNKSGEYGYAINFSKGDPPGMWHFDFYLNGTLQKSIHVEVLKLGSL